MNWRCVRSPGKKFVPLHVKHVSILVMGRFSELLHMLQPGLFQGVSVGSVDTIHSKMLCLLYHRG